MPVAILDERLRFPDPRHADAEGLVAIGGDFSVERLMLAYRSGIFPWTADPITWWSPDPRAIFELDQFHVSRSLARTIRKRVFQITTDQAFRKVMEGCAEPAVAPGTACGGPPGMAAGGSSPTITPPPWPQTRYR